MFRQRWRTNDTVAVLLVGASASAPWLMGANRAIFWLPLSGVIFLAASIFFAGLWWRKRALPLPVRRLNWPLLLAAGLLVFVGIQAMGGAGATQPRATALALIRLLSYATFFFLVLQLSINKTRARWMINALLAAIFTTAVFALWAPFGNVQLWPRFWPAGAQSGVHFPFVNRNTLATYLGFGLLAATALGMQRVNAVRAGAAGFSKGIDTGMISYSAAGVAMFVALVATGSRMGLAACLLALLFMLWLRFAKARGIRAGRVLALGASGLALAATGLWVYGDSLLGRLGHLGADADTRFALYQQVWEMIKARPWFGVGADSFELSFQAFHAPPVTPDHIWNKAHNSYLANWAELGLVAGSLPLLWLGYWFWRLARGASGHKQGGPMLWLGMGLIVQVAVHSLVDFSLEIPAVTYMFLALLALACAELFRR